MSSKRVALFLMLTAIVCLLQGCLLYHSAPDIRSALLKQTPVGTRYEVVEAFVKNKGWHWEQSSWSGPYPNVKLSDLESAGGSGTNIVSKEMEAHLGYHGTVLFSKWQISSYWLFDTNRELVDIYISKHLADL